MSRRPTLASAALRQALILIAVLGAIAAAAIAKQRQPDGADELRIALSTLQSQAAELDLLEREASRDHLPPRFVRSHAQQLTGQVRQARSELAGLALPPSLAPLRAQVLPVADRLVSAFEARRQKDAADTSSTAEQARRQLHEALQALDH
jgi:hypothetical protein